MRQHAALQAVVGPVLNRYHQSPVAGADSTRRYVLHGALALVLVAISARDVAAHDGAFEIRSTAKNGGPLSVGPARDREIEMVQTVCSGGQCTYANNEMAFRTPASDLPEQGLFALKEGTLVRLELIAADAGVSLALGAASLDKPGDSVVLGRATTMHVHPQPIATGSEGQVRDWSLTLRLTTGAKGYSDSAPIALVLTNAPATTTTSTTLPAPECGNGIIEADEQCDLGPDAWSAGHACRANCTLLACGDADGNGVRGASDALFVLRVAVGAQRCDDCLCNVDGVGAGANAADALRLLRFAVGAPGIALSCNACE